AVRQDGPGRRRSAHDGRGAGGGRGPRHPGRGAREDLRPVLHDKEPRPRSRPGHLPSDPGAAPRRHSCRQRGRTRDDGDLLPADRTMTVSPEAARVLIADDEDGLRWVLEKGLRQAGYEVTAVRDGDAALRAFAEAPFDLVFLDVRMPGTDGLTVL